MKDNMDMTVYKTWLQFIAMNDNKSVVKKWSSGVFQQAFTKMIKRHIKVSVIILWEHWEDLRMRIRETHLWYLRVAFKPLHSCWSCIWTSWTSMVKFFSFPKVKLFSHVHFFEVGSRLFLVITLLLTCDWMKTNNQKKPV